MDNINFLLFYMKTGYSTVLLEGKLLLIKRGILSRKYDATSGTASNQSRRDTNKKGKGLLPPNCDIGYKRYTVDTVALDRRGTKGIEGNAYLINPNKLTVNGVERSEFMIHRDANVPGSAGCIVLTNMAEWEDFQQQMKEVNNMGIITLPLIVDYYGE